MISPDFAVLAAVLPLAGFVSYIRDTLRGRTQPNRVSWSLWALAPGIAFPAELAGHAGLKTALVTLALGLGPLLVLAASFASPRAYWRLRRHDFLCGGISALALGAWAVTGQGDAAIALAIAADLLAAVPTIAKSCTHPESESAGTYVASGAGAGVTLLTIPHWTFAAFGFPAYVMSLCAVITALLAVPRVRRAAVSRRIRIATAVATAVVLLAGAGFAGYQLRSGRAVVLRPAQAGAASPGGAVNHELPPRPARRRHHARDNNSRPAPAVAPDPAPVPPPASTPVPSRTRRPSPAPTLSPYPSPGPQPSPSPAPSPNSSPTATPTPTTPTTPTLSPTPYGTPA